MVIEKKYTEQRKLIVGTNDLLTWCKENGEQGQIIMSEWDEEINGEMSSYKPGSDRVVYWKCSICGSAFAKSVRSRVRGKRHRPCGTRLGREKLIQYHKDSIKFENSLVGLKSELLTEWDYKSNTEKGIYPEYITVNSGKMVHWICSKCGHTYERRVRERTKLGYGCNECKKRMKKSSGA